MVDEVILYDGFDVNGEDDCLVVEDVEFEDDVEEDLYEVFCMDFCMFLGKWYVIYFYVGFECKVKVNIE